MCAWTVLAVTAGALGCGSDASGPGFEQTDLVSNVVGKAAVTDPNLRNPWGLARSANGPWWVADNQAGVSTRYDGQGNRLPLGAPVAVTVPPPADSPPGSPSLPTGVVFNGTSDFVVAEGSAAGPATFIFATEDGTIAGWNESVNPAAAILVADNSSTGAIYMGLAIGSTTEGSFLYATNFHDRTIDVFDRTYAPATLSGDFSDSGIPNTFAPFGIQNINGDLFVTYAKRSANQMEVVPGGSNGYVDVYDTDGNFIRRFASQGQLNAPWGITQAPISFGRFGGAMLIGNFGDGQLNAFDPVGGSFLGQVNRPNGKPVTIPGLWGLGFGNGGEAGSTDTLYFTSGPNDEQDGLFGSLQAENG